jgi:hypothetical protein
MRVRYSANASKALEVILWFAHRRDGIDIYHIVKGAFFADKYHITKWGRPITGDDYIAAPFGPLPQVIYGLLRHNPIEMLALGINGPLPFRVDDAHRVHGEREPNRARLASSDIEALEHGLSEVDGQSFDDLYEKTHDDPAYVNAVAGTMDYRDFIAADDPRRSEKISYIEDAAPSAAL